MTQLTTDQSQSAFESLVEQVRETFVQTTEQPILMNQVKPRLFRLKVDGGRLLELLTLHLSDEEKQTHNCSTCRDFLKYWGGAVSINKDGTFTSAIWPKELTGEAAIYQPALEKIRNELAMARVKGPVLNSVPAIGAAENATLGGFEHLNLERLFARIYGLDGSYHLDVDAEMNNHRHKLDGLQDNFLRYYRQTVHGDPAVNVAIDLLNHHKPVRWESMVAHLETHREFQDALSHALMEGGQVQRDRLMHLLSAIHTYIPRLNSTVLGEVLDALIGNLGPKEAIRRYNQYTDSDVYMRPTRELSESDTQRANEIIQELGLESSLRRREATMEDIEEHLLWTPQESQAKPDTGFFDHLREKKEEEKIMEMGTTNVSMDTFMTESIRDAERVIIHRGGGAIGGLLTAVSPDDKPIIAWDKEGARNPVSWYVFGRAMDCYPLEVKAICNLPCQWSGHNKFSGYVFVGKDMNFPSGSIKMGLFPEILRNELHTVRATIEKYSVSTHPQESDAPIRGMFIFDQPDQVGTILFRAEVIRGNRSWTYRVAGPSQSVKAN